MIFFKKHDFFQNSAMGFFCPMLFWVPYMFLNMEQRVAKMGIFDFLLGTIGYMCPLVLKKAAVEILPLHLFNVSHVAFFPCL